MKSGVPHLAQKPRSATEEERNVPELPARPGEVRALEVGERGERPADRLLAHAAMADADVDRLRVGGKAHRAALAAAGQHWRSRLSHSSFSCSPLSVATASAPANRNWSTPAALKRGLLCAGPSRHQHELGARRLEALRRRLGVLGIERVGRADAGGDRAGCLERRGGFRRVLVAVAREQPRCRPRRDSS